MQSKQVEFSRDPHRVSLLRALRTVSYVESSPIRESVFRDIASRSPVIRLALAAYALCCRLGMAHYLVVLYGVLYYLRAGMPAGTPCWLATGIYPNEVRQLNNIDAIMGDRRAARVDWNFLHIDNWFSLFRALSHPQDIRRFMRLLKRVIAGRNFMPACRLAMTLCLYARFRGWLGEHKVRAVVVTSDYSPDAAALVSAAAALGIARIYMPHALPNQDLLEGRCLLDFDLYIFDSRAMRDRFASGRTLPGQVVYRGIHGESHPLKLEPLGHGGLRIGIFLSGNVDTAGLKRLAADLGSIAPRYILIRGHPVAFANPDFSSLEQIDNVRISRGTTLAQDADACDLIIGGNTTALLETLKHGVPVVYFPGLDGQSYDYIGFVKDGLVPAIDSVSKLNIEGIKSFYAPPWPERLAYFDAAQEESPEKLRQELRQAVLALID